jgi:hypothetical protein
VAEQRRPPIEVGDIFRDHGAAWRRAHAGHISLGQLKVMAAIERCRTAALGGHVLRCDDCSAIEIAYNSCRNRHCAQIADIAYQNKAVIYDLLFKATAETLTTIAADPKHLGARIGFTAVLHTWGSAMTHHPHLHCIVPGGGLSPDGWIPCKRGFFLPVRVLSRLFRRTFLDKLHQAHRDGRLQFYGQHTGLADRSTFIQYLAPLVKSNWVVYAKRPFAGPEAVLAYLSRYTHRVAIANSRLLSHDQHHVTFKYKDYRAKNRDRYKTMRLDTDEFIRRFLIHVLPKGFHRIRHYGLFASHVRATNLQRIRNLLAVETPAQETMSNEDAERCTYVCQTCGAPMRVIERLDPTSRAPPMSQAA